ncbi:MAG: ABC transporter ATP-binding protein [Nitrospirota bacterium]
MIRLVDVKKAYFLPRITIDVLRGVNLEVHEGELLAVVGRSGSGKSTLLNIIGCLDRPTSGKYYLEGIDVGEKSDDELARIRNARIGFVFQTFNLLPRLPAWKNVAVPLLYAGVPAEERKERAMAMLKRVGLEHRAEHGPSELSGGEQQRVAIARALVNNPSIILADEPTGNLDTKAGEEVMDIFTKINSEGSTVVMVTHEKRLADIASRIVTIRDGVSSDGPD